MKSASEFRWSRSREEGRVRSLVKFAVGEEGCRLDVAVCLSCGAFAELRRNGDSLYLPIKCNFCGILYREKFSFCVPDLMLINEHGRRGIVFINEEATHGLNKVVKRDKIQIEGLRSVGYSIFVLKDLEIAYMSNASLMLWLHGAWCALSSPARAEAFYAGEKDYRCLI